MLIDNINDKFREECGVFGIYSNRKYDMSSLLYQALNSLQHRGQESCGVAVSNGKNISSFKGMGLVSEVFNNKSNEIYSKVAIGHTRYSTFGKSNLKNAQPILDEDIAIAHNGNITNANSHKKHLLSKGIVFDTETDSEVFLKLLKENREKDLEKSLINISKQIKGGYAIVLLFKNKLIGIRDEKGIRPLCIGKLDDGYVLASESCTLNILGAKFIRDVNPGEIVIIDKIGLKSTYFKNNIKCKTCSFEYIYFAREDSVIDGVDVYKSRFLAGKELYKEHPTEADIVIGVPDSGIPAAIGYSKASGIEYEIGFVKNKYVGRTFIQPSRKIRERDISIKLNVIKGNVKGKNIVLIDDSIVRGTTSKKIVEMLKKAGTDKIHLRIASPIINNPCYLGIDTKDKKELLGAKKNLKEIKEFLKVDSIEYISIGGFIKTLQGKNGICLKCFKK
ncbi:amidophosphoribosyltransferase [Tepidibacter formicigenes DSM 15518]|uniref:Amidophosphoribosyltransferase n=2 Tax=Tepidibacter TaxID=214904 RepID=A0A1M6PG47_9FIRM|nr:amidophosphoribosyltransferase [Tepidibacter formicigenes DSM 15518]